MHKFLLLLSLLVLLAAPAVAHEEGDSPLSPAFVGSWSSFSFTTLRSPSLFATAGGRPYHSGYATVVLPPLRGNDPLAPYLAHDWNAIRLNRINDASVDLGLQWVHFDFDSSEVDAASRAVLDYVADVLNRNPDIGITAQGHTDRMGADEYNLDLSRDRAESVRSFLVDAGVPARQLDVEVFGESRPVLDVDGPTRRNRRVEFGATPLWP